MLFDRAATPTEHCVVRSKEALSDQAPAGSPRPPPALAKSAHASQQGDTDSTKLTLSQVSFKFLRCQGQHAIASATTHATAILQWAGGRPRSALASAAARYICSLSPPPTSSHTLVWSSGFYIHTQPRLTFYRPLRVGGRGAHCRNGNPTDRGQSSEGERSECLKADIGGGGQRAPVLRVYRSSR